MQWDPPALSTRSAAEWQAELYRIVPRSDSLSWLLLHWEPGDVWQPVERWMVMQMVPRAYIQDFLLEDLEGPNPRTFGYWDAVKRRFIQRRPCLVSRTQWELYRRYGALARPYWVVQGTRGGHRRTYDHAEKTIIGIQTGQQNPEPPAPGDLPYAEPDERLIARLGEFDKMRVYKLTLDLAERSPEQLDAEDEEIQKNVRAELWRWLESQIEDAVKEVPSTMWARAVDQVWDAAVPVGPEYDTGRKLEALEEDWITNGD